MERKRKRSPASSTALVKSEESSSSGGVMTLEWTDADLLHYLRRKHLKETFADSLLDKVMSTFLAIEDQREVQVGFLFTKLDCKNVYEDDSNWNLISNILVKEGDNVLGRKITLEYAGSISQLSIRRIEVFCLPGQFYEQNNCAVRYYLWKLYNPFVNSEICEQGALDLANKVKELDLQLGLETLKHMWEMTSMKKEHEKKMREQQEKFQKAKDLLTYQGELLDKAKAAVAKRLLASSEIEKAIRQAQEKFQTLRRRYDG